MRRKLRREQETFVEREARLALIGCAGSGNQKSS